MCKVSILLHRLHSCSAAPTGCFIMPFCRWAIYLPTARNNGCNLGYQIVMQSFHSVLLGACVKKCGPPLDVMMSYELTWAWIVGCFVFPTNPALSITGHVQNPPAIRIHPRSKSTRSKSTRSNSRTAYRSRVRVRGISDSKK